MQDILAIQFVDTPLVGKNDGLHPDQTVAFSQAVVLKLVEGLEGMGHHLYMDSFYPTPTLIRELVI